MIDRHSDRPLYKQLADQLRDKIDSGDLAAGKVLPSEVYLAQEYGVSSTAVQQAIDLLLNEGLVTKGAGRRTVVRERPERAVRVLDGGDDVDTRMPNEAERRRLGIPLGEPVFELRHPDGEVELIAGASTRLRAL